MPYVKPEARQALDASIRDLAEKIAGLAGAQPEEMAFAGLLNYACTSLAMQVVARRFGRIRYGTIAALTGVFHNVADEFYRRVAAPYEDEQILKNGDVPAYAQAKGGPLP
jgi:hypothetical protein